MAISATRLINPETKSARLPCNCSPMRSSNKGTMSARGGYSSASELSLRSRMLVMAASVSPLPKRLKFAGSVWTPPGGATYLFIDTLSDHVRCSSKSGHSTGRLRSPLSVISDQMHRSKAIGAAAPGLSTSGFGYKWLLHIAKSSTVICFTAKSEYVAVISTVADGLRLACRCSFSTHRGKISFGQLHSLVLITEVVKNKQADRRG